MSDEKREWSLGHDCGCPDCLRIERNHLAAVSERLHNIITDALHNVAHIYSDYDANTIEPKGVQPAQRLLLPARTATGEEGGE